MGRTCAGARTGFAPDQLALLERAALHRELAERLQFRVVRILQVHLRRVVFATEVGGEGGVRVEGAFRPVMAAELVELGLLRDDFMLSGVRRDREEVNWGDCLLNKTVLADIG